MKVVLRSHKTLPFACGQSATVPLSRCSGPTLMSWRQCDSFIFHMCTARFSQASTTGQHDDDCGAETIWHRQSRPSYWARPAKQRWRHRSAARLREGHGCDVPRPMRLCAAGLGVPARCQDGAAELPHLAGGTLWDAGSAAGACPACSRHGNVVKRFSQTRVTLQMNVLSRWRVT